MSISKAEKGYNERDLLIGIALGAGLNQQQVAEQLEMDRKTIYNRLGTNGPFINEVKAHVERFVSTKITLNNEAAKARWQAMFEKATRNVDRMLDSEDPDLLVFATKETLDRVGGKPTQSIIQKIEGEVTHTHRTLPSEFVSVLTDLIQRTPRPALPEPTPLLSSAESSLPIIDAEIIEPAVHGDGAPGSP